MLSNRIYILFSCVAFITLSSCASLQTLEYNGYKSLNVKKNTTEPELQVDLNLHNPNPVGATLRDMTIHILVNGDTIGQAVITEKVRMKRKSDFTLPVTFATSYSQLGKVAKPGLDALFHDKEIPFHIQGVCTLSKFWIFRKTFAFEYTDQMKLNELIRF